MFSFLNIGISCRVAIRFGLLGFLCALACSANVLSQGSRQWQRESHDDEFGPVVRAYLGYLRAEQEVVDDRASRREISRAYFRRNSNRIRALRQIAIRIARETRNDYLPEMEAVARDEFGNLFEQTPNLETMRVGDVLVSAYRYLGMVRSGTEVFYIFARLDPYEQSELLRAAGRNSVAPSPSQTPAPASIDDTHANNNAPRVAQPSASPNP